MTGTIPPNWMHRAVAEVQVLALGLFVTAILARIINLLGFEKHVPPLKSTPAVINHEVIPFILFVLCLRLVVVTISTFRGWAKGNEMSHGNMSQKPRSLSATSSPLPPINRADEAGAGDSEDPGAETAAGRQHKRWRPARMSVPTAMDESD